MSLTIQKLLKIRREEVELRNANQTMEKLRMPRGLKQW